MSIVKTLSDRLDTTILPLVGGQPERICVLDVPDYPNVGDPAIYLGQMAFLRRHFPKAKFVLVSHRHYDETVDPLIRSADVIFLNGGGSFGNIWPSHHNFRLRMIEKFSGQPIIQLSQSFHFDDPGVLERTQRVLAGASKFNLLARDTKSLDFARKNFACAVHLAPDLAFAMGPLQAGVPRDDLVCLMRTDKEVVKQTSDTVLAQVAASGLSYSVVDWTDNRQNIERAHDVVRKAAKFGFPRRFIASHGTSLYDTYARSRLAHGIELLSRGRTVITDRLHGHIISTLLGKRQIVLDSLDGKVRQFNRTWLSDYADATFVDDVNDIGTAISRVAGTVDVAA